MHCPFRRHRAVHTGFFSVWRQVFWQKRHAMRPKERSTSCHLGAGVASPDERRVPRLCHITCRACKRCAAPRRRADFPAHRRHKLRQNGACHQQRGQEKNAHRYLQQTRHIMRQRSFLPFPARTILCSIWRQQSWRKNDVNCDNQQQCPALRGYPKSFNHFS